LRSARSGSKPPPRALYRGDEFIPVTPKALDTLVVLIEDAGKLVTKEDLMQRIWPDVVVEDGSIANNISMLRKILNPYFEDDGPIATISRRGYRFTAPVIPHSALRTPHSALRSRSPHS
jgi:DNA-binding winged helix-turn-helix (wHTH) protein